MKKALIWKLLLFLGMCPFIAPFIYYFIQCLNHNSLGSLSLADMLIMWSFIYWPTYIIGLILSVVSVYVFKK
ncbi:MAG: hypothetical protein IJO74_00805 [Clostridia bacterium]|nr:hypothetical protein [Clostridia bacterium]